MSTETSSNLTSKLTVKDIIILTILLAVLTSLLFGCSSPEPVSISEPSPVNGDTDVTYLKQLYKTYNEEFFNNHLPKDTEITTELGGVDDMANTWCKKDDGTACKIQFNLHYVAAPRSAQATLLHEMCHVRVWSKVLPDARPAIIDQNVYYHGRTWRSCMLAVDAAGAFRQINIDYYDGDK